MTGGYALPAARLASQHSHQRPVTRCCCCCCVQGRALLLLEKHLDAESSFLEGLAMEPAHKTLAEDLKTVQEVLAQVSGHVHDQIMNESSI